MNDSVDQLRLLFNDFTLWSVFQVLLVVILAYLFYRACQWFLPRVAEYFPPRFRLPILNAIPILRLVTTLAAILLIVPLVFNVTPKTLSFMLYGLGVLLGFAAKDLVGSWVAGIVAIFERPYRSGDWVRFGDDYGEVISIGSRTLRLQTADDDVVSIPHSRIWSENVINANDGGDSLMCVAEFHIDPNLVNRRIVPVLEEVARTSMWLDYDHPVVVVMQSQPFATTVKLKAYPYEIRDQFLFITDLLVRGREALSEEGIPLVRVPSLPGLVEQ